ncbi:hypothetical protein C923_02319 [Plasmodium falciparum UGT5.1]|uniref:Uncharacterized protein n=1 Tax=Plasmodium falciparum UGT5.1 TaxID=1237627 RepID=W7JDQ3_PLAFA|nr:hypothetical protein C923_02319 [Plasmodium falciparum UGT5.1]
MQLKILYSTFCPCPPNKKYANINKEKDHFFFFFLLMIIFFIKHLTLYIKPNYTFRIFLIYNHL